MAENKSEQKSVWDHFTSGCTFWRCGVCRIDNVPRDENCRHFRCGGRRPTEPAPESLPPPKCFCICCKKEVHFGGGGICADCAELRDAYREKYWDDKLRETLPKCKKCAEPLSFDDHHCKKQEMCAVCR
jgi:hypothetical protein